MSKCIWKLDASDYDSWETTCGYLFVLEEGTPLENDFVFCCYCGGVLMETNAEE